MLATEVCEYVIYNYNGVARFEPRKYVTLSVVGSEVRAYVHWMGDLGPVLEIIEGNALQANCASNKWQAIIDVADT